MFSQCPLANYAFFWCPVANLAKKNCLLNTVDRHVNSLLSALKLLIVDKIFAGGFIG